MGGTAASGAVGLGLAAHGLAGLWGTPLGKKEGTGNKRSGASRRRKAKMYQSLNAMVQSVLEGGDTPAADASAAAALAGAPMPAGPSPLVTLQPPRQLQQLSPPHPHQQQLQQLRQLQDLALPQQPGQVCEGMLTGWAPKGGSGSSSNNHSEHGIAEAVSQNSQQTLGIKEACPLADMQIAAGGGASYVGVCAPCAPRLNCHASCGVTMCEGQKAAARAQALLCLPFRPCSQALCIRPCPRIMSCGPCAARVCHPLDGRVVRPRMS